MGEKRYHHACNIGYQATNTPKEEDISPIRTFPCGLRCLHLSKSSAQLEKHCPSLRRVSYGIFIVKQVNYLILCKQNLVHYTGPSPIPPPQKLRCHAIHLSTPQAYSHKPHHREGQRCRHPATLIHLNCMEFK